MNREKRDINAGQMKEKSSIKDWHFWFVKKRQIITLIIIIIKEKTAN